MVRYLFIWLAMSMAMFTLTWFAREVSPRHRPIWPNGQYRPRRRKVIDRLCLIVLLTVPVLIFGHLVLRSVWRATHSVLR